MFLSRLHPRSLRDDDGAAMVLVIFVMIVGAIAATAIAASVFFVINGNVNNKRDTQAFVAAESGRDQIRGNLTVAAATGACDLSSTMSKKTIGAASGPYFDTSAQAVSVPDGVSAPTAWNGTLGLACPTIDTDYIVIKSTGYGVDDVAGEKATITSVYSWQVTPQESQGGTMAGTNGSFHGVGGGSSSSSIKGDLVVRSSNYTCSGSSFVDGDLWVLGGANGTNGGNVTVTGGCHISGSIYAAGTLSSNGGNDSNPIIIGKSIFAGGALTMDSNGVSIGAGCGLSDGADCGRIASGGAVNLTGTGGNARVKGAVTGTTAPVINASWKRLDGTTAVTGAIGPAPTFTPPLNSSYNGGSISGTVYEMTEWIEFSASTSWLGYPAVATRVVCPADPNAVLSAATGPVVLDYTVSGCGATSGQKTTITLSSGSVPNDAVFLVAPGKTMNVTLSGSLSGGSQLFFVHESLNTGTVATDCGRPSGDSFEVTGGTISPRIMVYTPCGLNGTWTGSLTGQLYVGGSMTYNGAFTCMPMAWTPGPSPMPQMGCRILGAGGVGGGNSYTFALGELVSQAEDR